MDKPIRSITQTDLMLYLEYLHRELKYSKLAEEGNPIYWRNEPDRPSAAVIADISEVERRLGCGY